MISTPVSSTTTGSPKQIEISSAQDPDPLDSYPQKYPKAKYQPKTAKIKSFALKSQKKRDYQKGFKLLQKISGKKQKNNLKILLLLNISKS